MKEPEIRCPRCFWRPQSESRWSCWPGCQAEWNTFWTAGVCPGCAKAWQTTVCLACAQISPHKDWYHFPEDEEKDEREPAAAKADV